MLDLQAFRGYRAGNPKQETNMTASRNTILAFGLMLLALSAGKSALGQHLRRIGCDALCLRGKLRLPLAQAGCDTGWQTGRCRLPTPPVARRPWRGR